MTPQETSNCQPPCVGVIGSGDWLGINNLSEKDTNNSDKNNT